jgi:glycine cleavage system H protein
MKKRVLKREEVSYSNTENRCIWMTAGVISFKLCPLNYDCEHCDFDKVMRLQARSTGLKSKEKRDIFETAIRAENTHTTILNTKESFFTFSVGEFDERLHLHPTHLWARLENEHTWKVGVDQLLAYVLPPPVRIELHSPNQVLIQEQTFGALLTEAGAVFVPVPLSGRLVQVNPNLAEEPKLLQQDPYGEGWLAMIDWFKDNSELLRFHTGPDSKIFLKEEAQHLKFLLKYRGVEVNQVGITLSDGGAKIQYLHQILPAEVCLRLAQEMIVLGKEMW